MLGALIRGTLKVVATLLVLLIVLGLLLAFHIWSAARGSLPMLEGEVEISGLSAAVSVERDAAGNAVITGSTRQDVAVALGFLHGQERFFQMDLLRRTAAGELGELLGGAGLGLDRLVRPHRFRARARAIVAQMPAEERALLEAYTEGVSRGRESLSRRPWEHALLFTPTRPWLPEDTVLVVFAMYLNLQPATPLREMDRALATKRGGPLLADFLYPDGSPNDAALDGSMLPEPPMPMVLAPAEDGESLPASQPRPLAPTPAEEPVVGSNNWAVAGALTANGAALVANDMHLGTRLPNTWYRARLIVRPADGSAEPALDIVGATLPGTPMMVVGSNGRVAWGFTNSYIDTADAVIVERAGSDDLYQTPTGPQPYRLHREQICGRFRCETLEVRETIWGPVIGEDLLGRTIAMRWTAHEPEAVRLAPALALERAGSVVEAVELAQRSAIPQQNFVVGDRDGAIAWTIMGQVPDRFGFDGRDPTSFADGTRGWRGTLAAEAVPVVKTPEDGRIWTANTRVLGGEVAALLGNGGWDHGGRAGRIRDLLRAQERFAPRDFLAIQLDDRSTVHDWWRERLLEELRARPRERAFADMIAPVEQWDGRMLPDSVGARLVTRFREIVRNRVYAGFMGGSPDGPFRRTYAPSQSEGPLRRLLEARPGALVPEGYESWERLIDDALGELAGEVRSSAGGRIERFTWGQVNRPGVGHPLAQFVPLLRFWTDPENVAVPGGRAAVRAQAPGFGASQRMAVSPGHEAEGLFHMPGGQAGNPLSPYYLAGHADWVEGRPTPLLPGPARWTLRLRPVA